MLVTSFYFLSDYLLVTRVVAGRNKPEDGMPKESVIETILRSKTSSVKVKCTNLRFTFLYQKTTANCWESGD